jgi:hypothetical protein
MISTLIGAASLHPALDQALSPFPAASQRQAHADLTTILHERLMVDGERAWTACRLTGDGFPVEFTFTTADNRLRYTVEPGRLSLAPQGRLETAIQVINQLSSCALPDYVADALREVQNGAALHYGAWLGCRYAPDASEYKIYVEAPGVVGDQANGALDPFSQLQIRLSNRIPTRRMIAYSPMSQRWEVYARIPAMAAHHMRGVLAPVGLESMADDLLQYITNAYGYALRERLPGQSVGVSYTMRAAEAPQSVTLFFFARVLWGGDARIRRRFGDLSAQLCWDDSRYQQVTAPLASRDMWQTYHGILGITLTRNRHVSLSIGVRPVEAGATP